MLRTALIALACLPGCAVPADLVVANTDGGADAAIEAAPPEAAPSSTHGTFCGQPGHSCSSPNDCCSGECTYNKTAGGSFCYDPPNTCAGNGKACLIDSDCCSLTCTNGTCATGCAELWTDCSSAGCCSGSCIDNVCQLAGPTCAGLGKTCSTGSQCCSGTCSNGACAERVCGARGTACSASTDCCTGTCSNGSCVDAPQCAWKGPCTNNFQCCTGACVQNGQTGQCAPPVGDTVCRFLEKQPDYGFADCFDCIGTSCCDAEYSSLSWASCFQDCVSSFDTWDSWSTCSAKCGAPSDALSACVKSSCATSCGVQP